jgi:hypothetical protein
MNIFQMSVENFFLFIYISVNYVLIVIRKLSGKFIHFQIISLKIFLLSNRSLLGFENFHFQKIRLEELSLKVKKFFTFTFHFRAILGFTDNDNFVNFSFIF